MNRVSTSIVLTAALLLCASGMQAGTIIKLNFGTDKNADIELVDGVLSTFADAVGSSAGDQNTEVSYLSILTEQGLTPPESDKSSFTLADVMLTGTVLGGVEGFALQATDGGAFALYDPNNDLLLSGTLGKGTLSGPIGGTATGGFLTTTFGNFTGGSLMPYLESHLHTTLSISLSDVNNGRGMGLNEVGTQLANFTADATANIGANPIPEPTAMSLLLIGAGVLCFTRRRGRSGRGIGR